MVEALTSQRTAVTATELLARPCLLPHPSTECVRLDTPLDELQDAWPVLRAFGDLLSEGASGVLRFSPVRLASSDVMTLLRLCRLVPVRVITAGNYRDIEVKFSAVSAATVACSVIVPCRNEVGNVSSLVHRLPTMGTHTELIFVDGSSTDGTPETIQKTIDAHPQRDIKLLHQAAASGKAGAVFQGFDAAQGDIFIILDADMTVAPEDLPRFYLALSEGVARFANGTRFVHPMESGAMRSLNALGNQAFRRFFSWLLDTRITDTLCGTKALLKTDWEHIRQAKSLFGGLDPWGDFDLLLSAAAIGLHIVEVPVRYGARTSGESKMHAFRHGWSLTRTCLAGARALKLPRARTGTR